MGKIQSLGRDPELLREVLAQARALDDATVATLTAEERSLSKDLTAWHQEVRTLAERIRPGDETGPLMARLAELQERIVAVENRLRTIRDRTHAAQHRRPDADEAAGALAAFEPVWGTLTPREQGRVLGLLVETVAYDGAKGKVAIAFRSAGIATLAAQSKHHRGANA